jgi:hypothetical protein
MLMLTAEKRELLRECGWERGEGGVEGLWLALQGQEAQLQLQGQGDVIG